MILKTSMLNKKLTVTPIDCSDEEIEIAKDIGSSIFNAIFSVHQACGYHSFSLTFFFDKHDQRITKVFGPGYLGENYVSALINLSRSSSYDEYEQHIKNLISILKNKEDFIPEQFSATALIDFIHGHLHSEGDCEHKNELFPLVRELLYKASLIPDFEYLIDDMGEAAELLRNDLVNRGFVKHYDQVWAISLSKFLNNINNVKITSPSCIEFSSRKSFYELSNVIDSYSLYTLLSQEGDEDRISQKLLSFLSNYNSEKREHRTLMVIHHAMENNPLLKNAFSKIAPANLLNKKENPKTPSGFEYINLQATFN